MIITNDEIKQLLPSSQDIFPLATKLQLFSSIFAIEYKKQLKKIYECAKIEKNCTFVTRKQPIAY